MLLRVLTDIQNDPQLAEKAKQSPEAVAASYGLSAEDSAALVSALKQSPTPFAADVSPAMYLGQQGTVTSITPNQVAAGSSAVLTAVCDWSIGSMPSNANDLLRLVLNGLTQVICTTARVSQEGTTLTLVTTNQAFDTAGRYTPVLQVQTGPVGDWQTGCTGVAGQFSVT